jgi:hypothetical protein
MESIGRGNTSRAPGGLDPSGANQLAADPQADENAIGYFPCNAGFHAMHSALHMSGGLARADELALLLERHGHGNFVSLARLIVSCGILGFEFRHEFWIPMFQFARHDLSVKAGPRQVLRELVAGFDGWESCRWFAVANERLNGERPANLIDSHLALVVEAARCNRAGLAVHKAHEFS